MRWFIIAATLMCSACAQRAAVMETPATALYRDLQRLVVLAETAGWKVDRTEVESLVPEALLSLCQVPERSREILIGQLKLKIRDLGGPAEKAYVERGKDLKRIADILEVTRVLKVLRAAHQAAAEDCPFWLEPTEGFHGRQIADDRWQVSVGGGGRVIFRFEGGEPDINFGGAGRLVFGRAFGTNWSLLAGADLGGSARFPKDENGDRGNVEFGFDVIAPVVLRYRFVNSFLEGEFGYYGTLSESIDNPEHGLHTGVTFGAVAARRRFFFPAAAFGIAYEQLYPRDVKGVEHTLRLGFRVSIDLNL